VVLALLGDADGIDGDEVTQRLGEAGRHAGPARVLGHLLALEDSGHVMVERGERYRFRLTRAGEAAAYDFGPGAAYSAVLVMGDIVGFVAFTSRCGDVAAHLLVQRLLEAAETELTAAGGRLVKSLGDGFLGILPPTKAGAAVARRIAGRFAANGDVDGRSLPLRLAIHRGCPIRHRGDVYGADVNLVARLCEAAAPDQILMSASTMSGSGDYEMLAIRGLNAAVPVVRMRMR